MTRGRAVAWASAGRVQGSARVAGGVFLCLLVLAGSVIAADTPQATEPSPATSDGKAQAAPGNAPRPPHSRYAPERFGGHAGLYYSLHWGIDSLTVRLVESGELVRFSYRVLDPAKARVLNDKQSEAKLNDTKAGVSLVVPTMEKIGPLRQTSTPEAGRSYWMTFSNKGRRVERGDWVDVVIGPFRANNLVVE